MLFDPLMELYDFTLDGAASHENAKVDRYCTAEGAYEVAADLIAALRCNCRHFDARHDIIGPGPVGYVHAQTCPMEMPKVTRPDGRVALRFSADDGLNVPWKDERVFLNPPWGDAGNGIAEFLRKARNESLRNRALVVAIIPARMDTNWMHDYVLPYARVTWKRGRTKFIDPSGQARGAPPVGIGIAVYR